MKFSETKLNEIFKVLDRGFLSHAYLIETDTNNLDIRNNILSFVKKMYECTYKNYDVTIPLEKLFYLIDNNNFPDYIEIKPINNQIKKEQLVFIRKEFSKASLYNTLKVYVVFDCEKMNASASNAILKFLEEPNENIVAIFVTSNQYNVLDTIRSRCQKIMLHFDSDKSLNYSPSMLSFIDDIAKRKEEDLLLKFNYYITNLFKDRATSSIFIKEILKYYREVLNEGDNFNVFEEIIIIIYVLDEKIKKLKYNVNMKLWLDDLLLSLMEV